MTDVVAYSPPRDAMSKVRRRVTQWRAARPTDLRFKKPLLSIAFDDFPVSAAETGARIMEAHGARATYYAAASMAETDGPCGRNFSARDIAHLSAAGHEIGCHTYDHADCAQRASFATLHSLAHNRDALAAMGAPAHAQTLAYPYGETSFALKTALPPRFTSARGVLPGINVGRVDLTQLRACAMFGEGWTRRLCNALVKASKKNGWVIGFTHDVAEAPSPWGTRGEDLTALLRFADELAFIVLPVSAALDRRL